MCNSIRSLLKLVILFLSAWCMSALANPERVAILTYHNFNPTVPGPMSVTPAKFESQVKWLKEHGFTVIPLKQLVSYLHGENVTLPEKSVVITADDGWESQYKYMYPIAQKYNIPVTLFIYPSTISNGKHTLTWNQLKELQKTGIVDIQCHTYWHPDFNYEKKHLSEKAYEKLVYTNLFRSKKRLENKLGTQISYVAWPYGIYNAYLEQQAEKAGYAMAFSIDDRKASKKENDMSQPRYLISENQSWKTFSSIVNPHKR